MHVNPEFPKQAGKTSVHREYLTLRDIELPGESTITMARLFCERGEGGPMVVAVCTGRDLPALEPYAEQLLAARQDPYEHVLPDVPIVFSANGTARFDAAQARDENPEHTELVQQRLAAQIPNSLVQAMGRIARFNKRTGYKAHFTVIVK